MSSTNPSSSSWEPPLPEDLQRMLPQYEITGILGRGGMGAVYKGRQAKLNRTVAIKVLPETFTRGVDELNFAKRFEQEAQAMAGLDHPAIISVYDFGETSEGQLYFVMEFIDGMDIHQYLQHHGGKLPQEHALSITAHVLDALDYAHSHGVIHRDIKPANILLNREGRVKIADFGLAKKFGDQADPSTPALTMSNMALGTPDFVAPEALEAGRTVDHRADLYAVGVMLYQMLTGRLPRGHFKSPSESNPDIDPRLDELVSKAMQTEPEDRYASASTVRLDLDRILSQPLARIEAGEDSEVVPVAVPATDSVKGGGKPAARGRSTVDKPQPASPPPPSRGPLYAGIGVAAAVLLGLGALFLNKKDDDPPATSVATAIPAAASPVPAKADPRPAIAEKKTSPPAPATPDPSPPTKAPAPATATSTTASVPAAPQPGTSVPSVPPAPTDPAPTNVSPPAMPAPAPSPLATLPGLKTRLDGYHSARRTQLGDLAAKYLAGLEARLGQAADAGDLRLATAYEAEKKHVQTLQSALAQPPADPVAAVTDTGATALPDLPADSPEPLVALRQTWITESAKVGTALDAALQQSLQALEAELTRARDFEKAKAVLTWRESLTKPVEVAGQAEVRPAPETAPAAPPAAGAAALQDSSLAAATKEKPFQNSLGMKFLPVPGTEVLFCIHETRWRDYAEYAKLNQDIAPDWRGQDHDGFTIRDDRMDHPVTNVSWDDAQKFCAWLSEKEGKTYRLPTDREWSLAVGIGDQEEWSAETTPETVFKVPNAFPWGDEWPPPEGVGNYSDASRQAKAPRDDAKYVEGGYDDGFPTTAPVMSFAANEFGLHDLGGNVWEWCEDWMNASKEHRVLRCGSWYNSDRGGLLSSYRSPSTPGSRRNDYGFRVVVVASSGSAGTEAGPPGSMPPASGAVPPAASGAPD